MVSVQLASLSTPLRKSIIKNLPSHSANETQLNSFLFNGMLLNFFSTAIIHMTSVHLDLLVNDTYIYQLLKISEYTTFFRAVTKYAVFSIALVAVALLTLVTLLIRGGPRLKFVELEKLMKSSNKKGDALLNGSAEELDFD